MFYVVLITVNLNKKYLQQTNPSINTKHPQLSTIHIELPVNPQSPPHDFPFRDRQQRSPTPIIIKLKSNKKVPPLQRREHTPPPLPTAIRLSRKLAAAFLSPAAINAAQPPVSRAAAAAATSKLRCCSRQSAPIARLPRLKFIRAARGHFCAAFSM